MLALPAAGEGSEPTRRSWQFWRRFRQALGLCVMTIDGSHQLEGAQEAATMSLCHSAFYIGADTIRLIIVNVNHE